MTPYDQEQLTTNLMDLTNTINLGKLMPFLVINGVYTNELLETEIGLGSAPEQTKRMILGLLKRGSEAFDNFIISLVQAEQFEAAHILRPDIEVPQPPPREEAGEDATSERVQSKSNVNVKLAVELYPGFPANDCYRMESTPRGLAVIFINDILQDKDNSREGVARDKELLNELFTQLGYKTQLHENSSKSTMNTILTSVTQDKELAAMDSFIVVISSRGKEESVVCYDSEVISVNEIQKTFNKENCPLLDGKPKLYLIQLCCGGDISCSLARSCGDSVVLSVSESVPTDTIVANVTTPGYLLHGAETGSWFTYLLTDVFAKRAWNTNLFSMLVEINRRINEIKVEGGEKSVAWTELQRWKKQFFFNPGM